MGAAWEARQSGFVYAARGLAAVLRAGRELKIEGVYRHGRGLMPIAEDVAVISNSRIDLAKTQAVRRSSAQIAGEAPQFAEGTGFSVLNSPVYSVRRTAAPVRIRRWEAEYFPDRSRTGLPRRAFPGLEDGRGHHLKLKGTEVIERLN